MKQRCQTQSARGRGVFLPSRSWAQEWVGALSGREPRQPQEYKFPSLYDFRSSVEERKACLGAITLKRLASSDAILGVQSDKKKL